MYLHNTHTNKEGIYHIPWVEVNGYLQGQRPKKRGNVQVKKFFKRICNNNEKVI